MNISSIAPILAILTVIGVVPVIAVIATAFTKITLVLLILRNALGVQQTPPNIIIFSVAIILTLHIMQPVFVASFAQLPVDRLATMPWTEFLEGAKAAAEPFRTFLHLNTESSSRDYFLNQLSKRDTAAAAATATDFAVLAPAFLLDEITKAFTVGFLIYIPFVIIDFAVGAVLIALGMQMMSATAISTPLKILLFVQVEGWFRIVDMLLTSYK